MNATVLDVAPSNGGDMNPNDDDVWMMVTRCDRGWRWTVYRGNVGQRSGVHQLEAVAYLVGWYVRTRVAAIVYREQLDPNLVDW